MKIWTLLTLGFIVGPLFAACGDAAYSLNHKANQYYAQGDYAQANENYRRVQVERPDLPQISYNLGNTLHRQGDYAKAVEETRRALFSNDEFILARAYYSLGNHYFRMNRLDEARTAYKNALIHNPNDTDAKFNLEVVLLLQRSTPQEGQSPQQNQPQATPTPQAGEGQQPQEGEPEENQPSPSPGTGNNKQREGNDSISRQIAAILREKGDREFTPEEALELLELLAQQQQQRQPRPNAESNGYRDW